MKSLKIIESNEREIEAALASVNGKAIMHTYITWQQVAQVAAHAEARLAAIGIPVNERPGAMYRAQSGDKLSQAYGFGAKTTSVDVLRRPSGWYLVHAFESFIHASSGPRQGRLTLTPRQDAKACEVLRRNYAVAAPEAHSADVVVLPGAGDRIKAVAEKVADRIIAARDGGDAA